jgi:tetratricopeptide (TPR) repeat protein
MWFSKRFRSGGSADDSAARQSDALLEEARCALDDQDPDRALEALRQARNLTPLRDDIRMLAGYAAEMRARPTSPQVLPRARVSASRMPAATPPMSEEDDPTAQLFPNMPIPAEPVMRPTAAKKPVRGKAIPAPAAPSPSEPMAFDPSAFDAALPLEMPEAAPVIKKKVGGTAASHRVLPTEPLPERRSSFVPNLVAWTAVIGLLGIVTISVVAVVQSGVVQWDGFGIWASESPASSSSAPPELLPPELHDQITGARRELASDEQMKAIARLQVALERWPKATETLQPILADAYFQQAERLKKEDSFNNAIVYYEKAAELTPERADIYHGAGWCHYYLGRHFQDRKNTKTAADYYRKALASFERALVSNPQTPKAELGKARVYAAQSQRQQAVSSYETIIKRFPNTPEAVEARRMLTTLTGKRS